VFEEVERVRSKEFARMDAPTWLEAHGLRAWMYSALVEVSSSPAKPVSRTSVSKVRVARGVPQKVHSSRHVPSDRGISGTGIGKNRHESHSKSLQRQQVHRGIARCTLLEINAP
jgi:hypothetical protein